MRFGWRGHGFVPIGFSVPLLLKPHFRCDGADRRPFRRGIAKVVLEAVRGASAIIQLAANGVHQWPLHGWGKSALKALADVLGQGARHMPKRRVNSAKRPSAARA